jgi:hypothetical protein
MRYFLLFAPACLALSERESTTATGLIPLHCAGHRLRSSGCTAAPATIAIASVTEPTEEEALAAAAASSDEERIHGLGWPAK